MVTICSHCQNPKLPTRDSWCPSCKNWANRQRYARDKEFREERLDHNKAFREANKELISEQYRRWALNNRASIYARMAKRRAAKFNATPLWADQGEIQQFYERAVKLTQETGIRHEVDHIIPLQSPVVSGLHVPANLQVLTQAENVRKSNRLISAA